MFSEVCIKNSVHGGGACVVYKVCAWWEGMSGRGHAWGGACAAGDTASAADGTHSTGMHSCFQIFSLFVWIGVNGSQAELFFKWNQLVPVVIKMNDE